MNEKIGQLLFVAGVGTTVVGGAKLPAGEATWPDTLPAFIAGAVIAAVGIYMWRKALAAAKAAGAVEEGSANDPVTLLLGLQEPLQKMADELEGLDHEGLTTRVDELLNEYVLPLAEVRQGIVDRFGMDKGAEVLVTVAYAERLLNRVWSAAADGHLPEAQSCFKESEAAFKEAAALIQAA